MCSIYRKGTVFCIILHRCTYIICIAYQVKQILHKINFQMSPSSFITVQDFMLKVSIIDSSLLTAEGSCTELDCTS